MRHIGMTVHEAARALGETVIYRAGAGNRADWEIATAQSLCQCHDVGSDPFVGASEKRPGSIGTAHDLIQDEQNAVAIADIAYPGEIARFGERGASGRPNHGF